MKEESVLGTMNDADLAKLLGRTNLAITLRRVRRRIGGVDQKWRYWTPKEDRILGTAPDSKIATQLNRTLLSIRMRRVKLRIPVFARAI
jgi:hypothetical protein